MKRIRSLIVFTFSTLLTGSLLAQPGPPTAAPATQPAASQTAPLFSPQKLGSSWRTQADEAIAKKDFAAARDLYAKWLQADPHDAAAWYNLACACSRLNENDKAFQALDTAVATGYTNARATRKDADLQALQSDPRFNAAVEHMTQREKMAAPRDFIRRFATMQSVGTYIVMLPPDYNISEKKYPICVILHGLGSDEERHGRIADQVGREGVIFIAPRAPYPYFKVQLPPGLHGWNAWPPDPIPASDPAMEEIPKDYVDWIFQCIHDTQKNYRTETGKVFIYGHSQGAEYALNCALLHPDEVNAVFAQAGFLPGPDLLPRGRLDTPDNIAKLKTNDVHVHLLAGKDDTTVSPENSKQIAARLEKAGVSTTLQLIPGTHALSLESLKIVRAWLDADVRPK